jgi:hypothetical protein
MIALQGLALFAFIPLVLWLFLVQAPGPAWSLALGLAIMAGHRAVAAAWAARHAQKRCLWCARRGDFASGLPVTRGSNSTTFGICSQSHARLARQFFGFLDRYRVAIRLGIFVPLALLLGGTALRAIGITVIPHAVNALMFRAIVAGTVVTASLAFRAAPASAEPRSAFPVHNFFLLGIRHTLWVFRLVGAWWLVAAAWQAARHF